MFGDHVLFFPYNVKDAHFEVAPLVAQDEFKALRALRRRVRQADDRLAPLADAVFRNKRDGCRICPANPQRTARRCGNRPHFPKALPAKRYRAKRGLRQRCRTGQSCTSGGNRCRADLAEEYAFRNYKCSETPSSLIKNA